MTEQDILIAVIVVLVVLPAVLLWRHWRLVLELDAVREELRYAEMANRQLREKNEQEIEGSLP